MNSVDLVIDLCKKRNIPIAKLERDCDFSNGYIKRLKEGKLPSDRLVIIAKYLGVSTDYLLTGEGLSAYYTSPETARLSQEIHDNPDLRILMDASRDLSAEDVKILIDMAQRLKGTNPNG